jgi:hypothetical protein
MAGHTSLLPRLKMHSERIPRSLLRGKRANTDIIKKSLHLGNSLQLAAGSFNLLIIGQMKMAGGPAMGAGLP